MYELMSIYVGYCKMLALSVFFESNIDYLIVFAYAIR